MNREVFLSYVHTPLVNPQGDPRGGSPTKSPLRHRWRKLEDWDVEAETKQYWKDLPNEDKQALMAVQADYWEGMKANLQGAGRSFTSEDSLRLPFGVAYTIPHNHAIVGASDLHATIETGGGGLSEPMLGRADYTLHHDDKLTGIIELKTWWKVTQTQIDEVRAGRERRTGDHHGRLAVEQAYGYMVHDKIIYGIITTFNGFVFLKRQSPGILRMSRMIQNDSTTPTLMQLLYFFSHLCARDSVPHPEANSEGVPVHLTRAEATASAAPKIPNPEVSPLASVRHPPVETQTSQTTPRRSPRRHMVKDSSSLRNRNEILCLDINSQGKGAHLGCKGWRGTLNTGRTVFVKLWDGWRFSSEGCDHEAAVYLEMRDIWGTIVPEFLGSGNWGFCHVLLLSYIECPMLYKVQYNPTVAKNILHAFRGLHAQKVWHGDVREENILVRPDNSVVVIDFEWSEINAQSDKLEAEMEEVKTLLAWWKLSD